MEGASPCGASAGAAAAGGASLMLQLVESESGGVSREIVQVGVGGAVATHGTPHSTHQRHTEH